MSAGDKQTHKRWTHLRVTMRTRERLEQAIRETLEQVEKGLQADPGVASETINPAQLGLSFDQMISLLLDRRDAHKARARKSKKANGEG